LCLLWLFFLEGMKYPAFRYESFEIDRTPTRITARFKFSIPPDISFTPEVHFESVREGWHSVPDEFLHNAIFHLGLIESFSYWKATASPRIEVHAGSLNDEQVRWWEDLLLHGMGEFFYRNDIDFTPPDFVKIIPMAGAVPKPYSASLPKRSLLTIGGGRDSALAAGLLRDSGHPFTCMMLNPSSAAQKIADHVSTTNPIVIRRAICPELLALNRRGFLNGHTPFSAYLAFLGAVGLLLYGYSDVIVANERSSDEGNVRYRENDINHQYSKSFRFERLFDEYLSKYLVAKGRYFSFVRPLYELQIGKLFSNFPAFFDLFKSCNRNRSDTWCGQCPKCLSVFLTMYPFVPRSALLKIFGADLFWREESIPIIRELAGLDIKPFECVATTAEILAALALSIEKAKSAGPSGPSDEDLPLVLEYAAHHVPGIAESAAASILRSYGPHRIPQELESFLTKALNRSPRSL
jgi:UDP-N-acetyl-alpha-D-muramoyl-L-alanyl-L-glutamate epimerase